MSVFRTQNVLDVLGPYLNGTPSLCTVIELGWDAASHGNCETVNTTK